jgi:hypothetical protein
MKNYGANITDFVASALPWFAPLPTAWVIGAAVVTWLGWPVPVAVVAALVVEGLGLSVTTTALELWNYNRGKRKIDPYAPAFVAIILVFFYFAVAIALTVLLDTVSGLARYAPAIFPAFSLVAMLILAIRADHSRRLAAIEAEKERRRAERKVSGKLPDGQGSFRKVSGKLPDGQGSFRKVSGKSDWRNLPADDRSIIAEMGVEAIMETYQVTERTARNWRAAARGDGVHRSGSGVFE